jgi:hypothetical protein
MTIHFSEQPARLLAPVHEAPFHQWAFPDGTLWTQFFRQGAGYLLRFPDLADFEVSADGARVQGFPTPGVTSATVEHLYLNQVLPLALSRQGKLVLHGSAVDIGGQGVAFLGESGRGKSTLAASFAAEGTRFLTDDGLLLEWAGEQCRIIPSHPSIRLWQDSEDALMNPDAATAPAVSFTSKSRFLAGQGIPFCDESRPLHRVFFLGDGTSETPTIEALRPAEALIELVKHSFLLDIEARDMLMRHFDDLTRLAALPIYFRLDYPRDYGALAAVRGAVVQQVLDLRQAHS